MASAAQSTSTAQPSNHARPAADSTRPTNDTESASQSAATPAPNRELWSLDSIYFDPQTMSALAIDRLQQYMRYESGPLYHLGTKDQVPGTVLLGCHSDV